MLLWKAKVMLLPTKYKTPCISAWGSKNYIKKWGVSSNGETWKKFKQRKHCILIRNSSLQNSLTFLITRRLSQRDAFGEPLGAILFERFSYCVLLCQHTMGLPTAHSVSHIVIKKAQLQIQFSNNKLIYNQISL